MIFFLFFLTPFVFSGHFSWLPHLQVPLDVDVVDLSNVVLADGRGLIQNRVICVLCGHKGGLKMRCDRQGCCVSAESKDATMMHVSCARAAGFEVRLDDKKDDRIFFYGTYILSLFVSAFTRSNFFVVVIISSLLSSWG